MLVKREVEISHCYHQCPYFGIDGGPSPVMVCNHPDAEDHGYIISHPECDNGFPAKCPLLKSSPPCTDSNAKVR